MEGIVDFAKLGGVIPKTVTMQPRAGNAPPRTVETASGMLNAIGLDNDGIDHFFTHHLPYLRDLPTAVIGNIAGKTADEFPAMAARFTAECGCAALELNLSCPNVAGGTDYATDPVLTHRIVRACRDVCGIPLIAKLTPNVTDITAIARAAADSGADAVTIANTLQGMAIDWRQRLPILGNVVGGLSGPAIKPIVLRMVWQVASQVPIPVIAAGGISSIDDVLEYLVAGATAVQIGTANFYNPELAGKLVDELDAVLNEQGCRRVQDIVGTLKVPVPGA
jgi:dihydroorotate dehydrogenase (NAD+) catalytic subunit